MKTVYVIYSKIQTAGSVYVEAPLYMYYTKEEAMLVLECLIKHYSDDFTEYFIKEESWT